MVATGVLKDWDGRTVYANADLKPTTAEQTQPAEAVTTAP